MIQALWPAYLSATATADCSVQRVSLADFVKRPSPRCATADCGSLALVGEAFVDGGLGVREVATLLGVSVPDAIVMLQDNGFARPIEKIRLSDEDRMARLRSIREERIERNGVLLVDSRLVAREVIATQRIEDVDARAWVQA